MGKFHQISRVMALDLRENFVSGLYLEHLLTNFLKTVLDSYQVGVVTISGLGLKLGKRQISTELWPLIYFKISFPGSIMSIY